MKFKLKAIAAATVFIATSAAFAAAPATEHSEAGTEIHWEGKVPVEFASDGVIMTSLNGTPLNEALKGGDLHISADGTFTSSSIPLELHYRTCDSSGTLITDGTDDCSAGTWLADTDPNAVGDLIEGSDWALLDARYNIGGMEDTELSTTAQILMDNAPMTEGGAAVVVTGGRPVFTTVNDTAATTAPSPGTQYSVYASILASNAM